MVRLSKIYTRLGDAGQTMLGDGSWASKCSLRVEAVGAIDEANAAVGAAAVVAGPYAELLGTVMNDLFDVGADVCTPVAEAETPGEKLRITGAHAARLEALIDTHNEPLAPLTSFVLPGGTEPAARLHAARTLVRRAERRLAALLDAEPGRVNPGAFVYLNRLSDLLFVLARRANADGAGDVLWVPGGTPP